MLPFVPGDREVFAMATWEAACGLCRASLGHLVDDGRFWKLWVLLSHHISHVPVLVLSGHRVWGGAAWLFRESWNGLGSKGH